MTWARHAAIALLAALSSPQAVADEGKVSFVKDREFAKVRRELVKRGDKNRDALVKLLKNEDTSAIAKEFVKLFVKDVLDPMREGEGLDDSDLRKAQETVERLRPLASEAVLASFGVVMTEAVERQLQKELGR